MTDRAPLPPELTRIDVMDEAWAVRSPGERLRAVRRAAPRLKERLAASGKAVSVRTFDISSLPYPAKFGLMGAARSPIANVIMRNRMQLVQVSSQGRLINVLVNPTDPERSQAAPFIAKQLRRYGDFIANVMKSRLVHGSPLDALAKVGVAPEDIDYITFDHLHVQDVRGLLGTSSPEPGRSEPTPAALPNAKLLVQRDELDTFACMHPAQVYWYVRDCVRGVPADRLVALDGDYLLGDGLALVRTPGHTAGNHTPAINTDTGVWTISENGIAVECYAPEHSRNPGLRNYARHYEVEVILNGNTRDGSLDQYTSMILEKTLADPSVARPEFPQHFPSSELEASPLAPGLRPTFTHRHITHGVVQQKASFRARTAAA